MLVRKVPQTNLSLLFEQLYASVNNTEMILQTVQNMSPYFFIY